MTRTVGLVGLGNMGAMIGARLAERNDVLGFDLDPGRREAAAVTGVRAASSLGEFADVDVVLLSLPSPRASLAVGRDLREILADDALVIETSTVNPPDMRALAAELGAIRCVDAAVLSGVGTMRSGAAILLLGGADADLRRAEPTLADMSSRRLPFGPLGSGMAAKVVNNAVAHAVMVVLAEAVALAGANGISLDAISELLADPEAGLSRPLTHRIMERVAQGDFDGGMPTEAARKDSQLALELAQRDNVPLFAIQAAHTAYELAMARGLGRDDYAAIARLWQDWIPSAAPQPDDSDRTDPR